jgi:hypothetical protein
MSESFLLSVDGYLVQKETRYRNEDYDLFMRMYRAGCGVMSAPRLYIYYRDWRRSGAGNTVPRLTKPGEVPEFQSAGAHAVWFFYAAKPLVVGLFPQQALNVFRAARYRFRQS